MWHLIPSYVNTDCHIEWIARYGAKYGEILAAIINNTTPETLKVGKQNNYFSLSPHISISYY
jgi:hypothetical protein